MIGAYSATEWALALDDAPPSGTKGEPLNGSKEKRGHRPLRKTKVSKIVLRRGYRLIPFGSLPVLGGSLVSDGVH
jgi:hypothetical protein